MSKDQSTYLRQGSGGQAKKSKEPKISVSQKKIKELETKCQEYLTGWQRAQADYENLKKETAKKSLELKEYVQAGLVLDFLPIYDHYQLALSHLPKEASKAEWVQGIIHIKKDFSEFLKQFEISEIKTVGEKFNPRFHEALSQQESDTEEDQIIKEIKPGYQMKDQVIRPAQVVVSKKKSDKQ